jgi:hypothetical protein
VGLSLPLRCRCLSHAKTAVMSGVMAVEEGWGEEEEEKKEEECLEEE